MPRNSTAPLVALLLAGCATGVPVERQTVVAGDRFNNVQGEARFVVRTFLPGEPEGERREVVGARCTAVSSLYQAEFATPTRLVVPNFGAQSPQISVTCTADDLSGSATAKIVTRWDGPPPVYPGVWGPAWGPGWGAWGWGSYGYPVSEYPDLYVVLR